MYRVIIKYKIEKIVITTTLKNKNDIYFETNFIR